MRIELEVDEFLGYQSDEVYIPLHRTVRSLMKILDGSQNGLASEHVIDFERSAL
jgi:hypothetical protein